MAQRLRAMLKTRRIATIVLASCAAAALAPSGAEAAKKTAYAGKTVEGSKISFVLDGKWVDQISTMVPYSCVSAQGGPPTAGMTSWAPPYKFQLGSRDAKVTVEEPWPTRNYTITVTGKRGKAIRGKLAVNYSMTVPYEWGTYRILTCNGTASFTAKPKKR
jgi:hypothetical protein